MQGNILILSAGRRVSLVKAFMQSASQYSPDIKIMTGEANPYLSSACQISHGSVKTPRINDVEFIPFIQHYCEQWNIKIIVPTIDTELLVLARNKKVFENTGIYIMVPDEDFVSICRNKRLTHSYFLEKGISVAREQLKENLTYPLFAKPEDGSSSNQLFYAPDAGHLPPFVLEDPRFMLLEYLDRKWYDEYTADTYFNRDGIICCIVPRQRLETRGGEISKGFTSKNFLVNWIKNKFTHIPGARGCITMQFFVHRETNEVKGIEINPRFGGGYPLSYFAGADYPKWIIEEYLYKNNISWFNEWEDHLLMLRHDNEIIIHDYQNK